MFQLCTSFSNCANSISSVDKRALSSNMCYMFIVCRMLRQSLGIPKWMRWYLKVPTLYWGRFLEWYALKDWLGIQEANCNVEWQWEDGGWWQFIQKKQHGERHGGVKIDSMFTVLLKPQHSWKGLGYFSGRKVSGIGFTLVLLWVPGHLPAKIGALLVGMRVWNLSRELS